MSETDKSFTKVTPGRGKKTKIVTPGTKRPSQTSTYLQSELTAQTTLFQGESEADWTDLNMGATNNLIQIQTLMPERRPFSQPTTNYVITFKQELIIALTKCPDPESRQGYVTTRIRDRLDSGIET